MTRVTSTKYHALEIAGATVPFINGEAEVSTPAVLESLRALNPAFGITVHDEGGQAVESQDAAESGEPADPDRPAGNASAEEWAEYAARLGVEVAEGAKRSEIQTAVDIALS